jgi:hypothetical protein
MVNCSCGLRKKIEETVRFLEAEAKTRFRTEAEPKALLLCVKFLKEKILEQQEPFEGIASCYYCGEIITNDNEKNFIYIPSLDMGKEKKPLHESCSRRYT